MERDDGGEYKSCEFFGSLVMKSFRRVGDGNEADSGGDGMKR